MDTEKQRQHRHYDVSLTESGNTRSEQLIMIPTESLTNQRMALVRLEKAMGWCTT